jgi:RAB protein geranylgeranyltransferase component A
MLSNGPFVKFLLETGVANYVEFKLLDNVFILHDKKLMQVPVNKEDIFLNEQMSLVEKRKLMKLFNIVSNRESISSSENTRSFYDFVLQFGLSSESIMMIMYVYLNSESEEDIRQCKSSLFFLRRFRGFCNTTNLIFHKFSREVWKACVFVSDLWDVGTATGV